VKVGNGSFNKDEDEANKLAVSLVNVAKEAGLRCSAVLTDMNQVLGWNAGHSLEILEAIEYLKNNKKNKRLENITNELISVLLVMIKDISKEEALKLIQDVIDNGKAAEKFEHMVSALGGPKDILTSFNNKVPKAPYREDIFGFSNGIVKSINTRRLGMLLIELGGGRKQINDKIDFSVGLEKVINVGSQVDSSTPLLTLHAKTKESVDNIRKQIKECFEITTTAELELKTIYKTIT